MDSGDFMSLLGPGGNLDLCGDTEWAAHGEGRWGQVCCMAEKDRVRETHAPSLGSAQSGPSGTQLARSG